MHYEQVTICTATTTRDWADMRVLRKIAATILLLAMCACFGPGKSTAAHGVDKGIMRVTFLYAIENTGGRGEKLISPMDIFYDRQKGELYVAEAGHKGILIYDRNGMFRDKITVVSEGGAPTMIAVDQAGRMYVGLNLSPKIHVLDYRGAVLESLDLPGVGDGSADGVRPLYLSAGGPDGMVYALKSRGGLVRIDPTGLAHEEITIAGDKEEDGPNSIFGMAIDGSGRLLFSDMRPYSVVRFDRESKAFKRFGSPGILYGQIARPSGIDTDDEGHIFVTSTVRNQVLCYDQDGNFVEEFGGIGKNYGHFYMPSKIVSDGKDRLFVLESALKRIQVFQVEFPGGPQVMPDQKNSTEKEVPANSNS